MRATRRVRKGLSVQGLGSRLRVLPLLPRDQFPHMVQLYVERGEIILGERRFRVLMYTPNPQP